MYWKIGKPNNGKRVITLGQERKAFFIETLQRYGILTEEGNLANVSDDTMEERIHDLFFPDRKPLASAVRENRKPTTKSSPPQQQIRRASRPALNEPIDDAEEGLVPAAQAARPTNQIPRRELKKYGSPRRRFHWLFFVGLGLCLAVLLWFPLSSLFNWAGSEINTIRYGNPPTFQVDAVVGHHDSAQNPSHFVAINLRGQVIVIEFPGGNPAKATDYAGPDLIAPGEDQLPVTLSFQDINHDGKVDMLVHVSDRIFTFLNNGTNFGNQPAS